MVIEVATRLSGGWLSTDQIPLGTGVSIIQAAISIALGESLREDELTASKCKGVAIRYFFPKPGPVKSLAGIEKYLKKSWVHKLEFYHSPGEMFNSVRNHTQRAGFVITTGENRDEAVSRAEEVVNYVAYLMDAPN
jgi:biotin carboxylase